jgi:hypothetical protein
VKFRLLIHRPIFPPNHVPGAPLPDKVCVEIGECFVDARDRAEVVEIFHAAQASGLENLKGRTIRDIQPVLNGREPGVQES